MSGVSKQLVHQPYSAPLPSGADNETSRNNVYKCLLNLKYLPAPNLRKRQDEEEPRLRRARDGGGVYFSLQPPAANERKS